VAFKKQYGQCVFVQGMGFICIAMNVKEWDTAGS